MIVLVRLGRDLELREALDMTIAQRDSGEGGLPRIAGLERMAYGMTGCGQSLAWEL